MSGRRERGVCIPWMDPGYGEHCNFHLRLQLDGRYERALNNQGGGGEIRTCGSLFR